MEKFVLASEARDLGAKLSTLRASKKVPAVVYGHAFDPVHISVDASEFLKTYRKTGGTHLIDLTVGGKKQSVLVHETQRHPVSGDFLHIDFFAVSAKEKITVDVPVSLVGKSQAVVEGAEINQNLHTITVKVLPADLVDSIEVDVVALAKPGDVIHVSDIVALYPKLEIITPGVEAIASASLPKEYSDAHEVSDIADVATVQDEKAASKESAE
ncbi:MAG: 50S ribosomal protein L25 [Patescibacteria group bacterium]